MWKPFFQRVILYEVRNLHICILSFLSLCCWASPSLAQSRIRQYEDYIEKYCRLAQEHQRQYGIPASITLAQGLLESGAGCSELSRKANNHFGIKCHDWGGAKIYYKKDCYRKYRRVEDSYRDHSDFLSRSRYKDLYKLKLTDYKGWARGLKRCGYATDPSYAEKLIRIIELYDLNRFVKNVGSGRKKTETDRRNPYELAAVGDNARHDVYRAWGLLYVEAYEGDTYEMIAAELGFKAKDLARYNDSKTKRILSAGEVVYLEKKHKKAVGENSFHTVCGDESLYDLAQRYGIDLKHFAKRNKMKRDAVLHEGQSLRLR